MEELKIVENGLVPVYETSIGERVVYGTELHVVLEAKTKFADWVKRRLKDCDAMENEDFEAISQNWENGGRSIEYVIKLDIAKEMAMLERNSKGKQVRRYFIELEKRYKLAQKINAEQTEKIMAFLEKQDNFNQMVLERFEKMENRSIGISSRNPFSVQQDVIDQRMRTLNGLIDQVADLCQMERNKVLHFLYKTLQESLGMTLNPYLMVMKSERGDDTICNLHVIVSVDRFYERATEMCRDVIERKNLFD